MRGEDREEAGCPQVSVGRDSSDSERRLQWPVSPSRALPRLRALCARQTTGQLEGQQALPSDPPLLPRLGGGGERKHGFCPPTGCLTSGSCLTLGIHGASLTRAGNPTRPVPPSARETGVRGRGIASSISQPFAACTEAARPAEPRGSRSLSHAHPRRSSAPGAAGPSRAQWGPSVLVSLEGTEAQLQHGQPEASPTSGWG